MVDLQLIRSKIYEIRGQQVMLDFDLAQMYGTETKVLKQAVKRNIKHFPTDFMFELNKEEFEFLRSQIVTSNQRGRNTLYALCLYRARSGNAFFYIE